jgi:hypothetical protein
MEAHGIDSYTIQLPKIIRNIKAITVGKQHSYSFFNDWQIIKAELTDSNGKKFIFSWIKIKMRLADLMIMLKVYKLKMHVYFKNQLIYKDGMKTYFNLLNKISLQFLKTK